MTYPDHPRCRCVIVTVDAEEPQLSWLRVPATTAMIEWLELEAFRRNTSVAELVSEALGAYQAVSSKVQVR